MKYILFFKSYLINCHFLKTETRKLTSLSIFFSSQVFFCFSIAVLAGPTMQLFGYQLVLYLMATRARGQDWGQEQPQDETRAGQLVSGPECGRHTFFKHITLACNIFIFLFLLSVVSYVISRRDVICYVISHVIAYVISIREIV